MTTLRFYGWQRASLYDLAGGARGTGGRLVVEVPLTLQDRDEPTATAQDRIRFLIAGPPDVTGLLPGALGAMMPPPNSTDAEATHFVTVDLSAPDLPWRYTPELAAPDPADPTGKKRLARLRPWLVLVVGTAEGDELALTGDQHVTLKETARRIHDLEHAARWAHVQQDLASGQTIARLLSPRKLDDSPPYTEFLAALVPAFDASGDPAWTTAPGEANDVTIRCYHAWRFRTGPAGDFKTLATQLRPARPDPELGRAALTYECPDGTSLTLSVRGALAPIGAIDDPLPEAVQADMANRIAAQAGEGGRPLLTLPRYGAAWVADPLEPTWGRQVNTDPRHRGVAGLGLELGIAYQELIMAAVTAQLGALGTAAGRIRHLTLGLAASRSLWQRRLPRTSAARLLLYGPALRRLPTAHGPVLAQIAGGVRPLAPRLFSSAARRLLRPGTAWRRRARPAAAHPAALLAAANRCPPPPPRAPAGLPHTDSLEQALHLPSLEEALRADHFSVDALLAHLRAGAARLHFPGLDARLDEIEAAVRLGRVSYLDLLALITAVDGGDINAIKTLLARFPHVATAGGGMASYEPVSTDREQAVRALGKALLTTPPDRPCQPIDLAALERRLTSAIDPTSAAPLAQRRVLATIDGLGDQPLAPTELCVGIDLPTWTLLRDRMPDWLLPGVGTLAPDTVAALESNPTFVQALLLGLNTQVLAELRWRHVPVARGCTPMHMFWGRTEIGATQHQPDVHGVETWAASSPLGDPAHQDLGPAAASGSGRDLSVVFRTTLFRRYPHTVVYALPATLLANGQPNWNDNPPDGAQPVIPTFQGNIGDDIVFFRFPLTPEAARNWWIVLEEHPAGLHFDNEKPDANLSAITDGATFAATTLHNPVRVLIRGDSLIP